MGGAASEHGRQRSLVRPHRLSDGTAPYFFKRAGQFFIVHDALSTAGYVLRRPPDPNRQEHLTAAVARENAPRTSQLCLAGPEQPRARPRSGQLSASQAGAPGSPHAQTAVCWQCPRLCLQRTVSTHTRIHTRSHTHIRSHMHTHAHAHALTCSHACAHVHTHAYICSRMHTPMLTCACTRTCMPMLTHAHTLTCRHVHAHTHVHTHTTHAHTCSHALAHTYTRSHAHTCSRSHTCTDTHTHMFTNMHAHTCSHAHAHPCTRPHMLTHAHTYTCSHIHACTHIQTCSHTHTYPTHACTHTHAPVPCGLLISCFLGKGQPQMSRNMPEARTLGEPGSRADQRAACGHLGGSGQTCFCTGTTQRASPGQALLCSHFS